MTNDKTKEPIACEETDLQLTEKEETPSNEDRIKTLLAKTEMMIAKCKSRKKKKKAV